MPDITVTMLRTGRLSIKGELRAEEDLAIDGTFEGVIDVRGHHLLMGTESRVDAAVLAGVVTVLGCVTGHITADIVDIGETAVVKADVMSAQLALADGGQFNGSVNTERARAAVAVAQHRFRQGPAAK